MKNIITSSRFASLTITGCYFSVGGIWALYANKFFVFILPETTIAHSSGSCYWCFIVLSSGLLYLLLYSWKSTQTESEESLSKLTRALNSYSGRTNAMINANDEVLLMREVCRICVEVSGYRMAWIAFAENDTHKTLTAVTHWGDDICFFESFEATWKNNRNGQGPAGTAIRTGRPVIFQDLTNNPSKPLDRETAKKCNYGSCISLPLQDDKQVFGALVIFDANPNAFDKEEQLLLEEFAGDLSYGIKNLRLKVKHKQDTEERLMCVAVTEQTSDGVITFDANGTIQYLNPSFIKLCGIPASEGVGVSIHDFECSKRNPEFYQAVSGSFESKTVRTGRFINKDRDGIEHDIDARIAPVFDRSGEILRYVVTVREISQEVQLQRQLRQAQKMEALATISGRMAHDFNNILAIIMTNSEMGIVGDQAGNAVQDNLLRIHKAAIRGKKTVKQFMSINQQKKKPNQQLKISDVVTSSMNLFRATVPATIQLKNDVTPDIGLIAGNPTQINQVIMNLCTNARDAMLHTGGLLEVSLSCMDIPIERIHQYPELCPGKHVKLIITDTGHGMNREELEHVFDPFYTTKGQGKGRGLGLSITYGVVKNHGGIIYANSIVDVGTTFVMLLPLIDATGDKNGKGA